MPRIVVGVDAGGSSTLAALAQDGEVVRTFSGPPANASVCGIETAAAIVADTVVATLDGALPHAIFVGAAGAGRPEVADGIRASLESRFGAARIGVRDDAFIALRACVPEGDGAVLISGTGSIAYAVRGDAEFRSGGYGYVLGDDGSGFAIGSVALRSALRVLDERAPRDPFTDRILAQVRADTIAGVLARVYEEGGGVPFVASLAQLVLDAANEGDRSANKIVQTAALELSEMGKSIVKRAGLSETGAPFVLAGSLLANSSLLTFLLETRLKNDLPGMAIYKSAAEPVTGALAAAQSL